MRFFVVVRRWVGRRLLWLLVGVACCASACTSDPAISREDDDRPASIDQLTAGYWRPVRVSDVLVEPNEGDYWNFVTQEGGFAINGFDGCNSFGSSTQPGDEPPSLSNGRVDNLALIETAVECENVTYGPHPSDGEIFTVSAHGMRLEVGDGTATRVVLVRVPDVDSSSLDRGGR